jgi:DNA primase
VDWGSLLIKYGIEIPNKNEFSLLCPFHEDRRESCSINLDKGLWICFAGCGQGSLKSFIWKYSGRPWKEIESDIESQKWDLDLAFLDDIEKELNSGSYIQDVEIVSSYEGWTSDVPSTHWIYDRDFEIATISRWDCKSNRYNDLIVPCKNRENEVLGWITRRTQAIPKYLYSKGFRKSKTLFGINSLPEKVDTLFVVEGALDCMWLDQHGYSAVAILGAMMSKAQIDLISSINPNEVVLCLDNDEAGRNGINQATIDLRNSFMLSYIELPNNVKDVQEIRQRDVLQDIMENRTLW